MARGDAKARTEPKPRNANDLYPTPACVAFAVRGFLAQRYPWSLREAWHDPAAGFGTLLEWLGIPMSLRYATELSRWRPQIAELERRVPRTNLWVGANALEDAWPFAHRIENPPFSGLDAFVDRTIEQRRPGQLACVLAPVNFWHAQGRWEVPPPDWFLALGWRPNFTAGLKAGGEPGSSPNQDYSVAIYTGENQGTRWVRVERPDVPQELVIEHRRLAQLACEAP